MTDITHDAIPGLLKSDTKTFWSIFVVGFVVFMVIALSTQLLTSKWRFWLPGSEGDKSLIHGVKDAVYTFMSHLT